MSTRRKRILTSAFGGLLTLAIIAMALGACTPQPTAEPTPIPLVTPTPATQEVIVTFGGWRTATKKLNRVFAAFSEEQRHIAVTFDLSTSGEYDAVLEAQLEAGTAPDLFYLRSFSASRTLYQQGYLEPLIDLPGLKQGFEPSAFAPWATDDGVPYGVPFTATSHGIYYNQDLFEQLGLNVPQTWDELLAAAQAIQEAGYIPLANGTKDKWTSAEIIFMNLAPNFIGGREGRMEYLTGKRCFNDEHVVAAFQAVKDLSAFFPENHELLGYIDSLQLFVQGKAVMWMSGSWDIPYFKKAEPAFAWSVFAIPPPAGLPAHLVFHPDVGIGLNANSAHKEEAREVLSWMTKPAFGELLGNEMPGFFPMHQDEITLADVHANAFLALNQGRSTDIRFAWEKLGDGSPDGYTLMQQGAEGVLRGKQTPQQAADALQAGLVQWFEPAQICGR